MGQVDSWYYPEQGKPFTFVGCPRRACKIIAKAYNIDGPWELTPEFAALLDDEIADPIFLDASIPPEKRKKSLSKYKESVWGKAPGQCYFCGISITYDEMIIDHFEAQKVGGTDDISNLVPACKSCNLTKGAKTIEEFRFSIEQRAFSLVSGVEFSSAQMDYLRSIGVKLDVHPYVFWFEKQDA